MNTDLLDDDGLSLGALDSARHLAFTVVHWGHLQITTHLFNDTLDTFLSDFQIRNIFMRIWFSQTPGIYSGTLVTQANHNTFI